MNTENFPSWLFQHIHDQNIVCDDKNEVTYSELREAVERMRKFFAPYKDKVYCVHVPIRNDIVSVVVILSLLVEKVNFFLFSPHSSNSSTIPDFCDKLLLIKKDIQLKEVSQGLELHPNPSLDKEEKSVSFKPGSGTVLFSSSGTTGVPKFICFDVQKVIQNAKRCILRFQLNSEHRVLIPVPVNHMYGLGVGLLPAIISGANICLIDKNNVIKLNDKILKFRPNLTLLTPTVCKILLRLNKRIGSSGTFISAGDKLSKDVYLDFELKYGKLTSLYGCTEMGAIATSEPDGDIRERVSGVVVPLDNINIQIKEKENGEIWCKHEAGFEFYVDKFGRRCADQSKEGPWYRTKDLGESIGKGFRVLGRIDNCISRSGFLVSLQEIEITLENIFQEFLQVIVLKGDNESMLGNNLVAVCELNKKNINDLSPDIIKTICLKQMPKHWIPDSFYFSSEIPKLFNGKPDRELLRKSIQVNPQNLLSQDHGKNYN